MSSVTPLDLDLPLAERQAERRQRIMDVALEVFARPGRRHDDIQEIAKRARVGKATVYREFGSRNGLLVAVATEGIEDLLARMVQAAESAGDPEAGVASAVRTALAFFDERPRLARILLLEAGESRDPIVAAYLERYAVSRSAAVALFEDSTVPAALSDRPRGDLIDVLMYLITGRLFYWVLTGQRTRLVADAETLTRAYLGGVMQKG